MSHTRPRPDFSATNFLQMKTMAQPVPLEKALSVEQPHLSEVHNSVQWKGILYVRRCVLVGANSSGFLKNITYQ